MQTSKPEYQETGNRRCLQLQASGWLAPPPLWIMLLVVSAVGSAATQAQAPADLFKHFVSAPPALSDLTWVQELPSVGTTNYFRLKYQPGALFLGEAGSWPLSRTDLDAYQTIVSSFGNIYWDRSFNGLYVWTNTGNTREIGSIVDFHYNFAKGTEVTRILNMGVQQAPVGAIHWLNDTFVLTNASPKLRWGLFQTWEGYWLSGELFRDSKGRAARLAVVPHMMGGRRPLPPGLIQVYEYSYDRPLALPYLPSTINVYFTTANKSERMAERLRIVHVQEASSPLPESAFSLWPYHGTNVQASWFVSNEFLLSIGGYEPPKLDPYKASLNRRRNLRPLYFTAAITLLCLGPVILWFRRRFVPSGTTAEPVANT